MRRIFINAGGTSGFWAEGQFLRKVTLSSGATATLSSNTEYTALCYGGDSVLYGATNKSIGIINQTTGVFTAIVDIDTKVDNIVYKDADELWYTSGNSLILLETNINTATGTCVLTTETLTSVTVVNDGFYPSGVCTAAVTGGGGTGATVTPVLSEGLVTGVTVDTAGTGYTSVPTITFSAGEKGEYTYVKQDI